MKSRLRAAAWRVLVFFVALAAFEIVVDRVSSPFQGADKVEKKFAYFAAHKDAYDFVFVGSSRVMNQLSPRVFDAQMAAAGRPCRSFNLGFAAMFLPECSFLIDRIRALHPAHLRGMVIEASSPAPRHDAEHPLTERDIYWHRLAPTILACDAVLTDPDSHASATGRAAQVWLQATIFARCMVHLGSGPQLLAGMRKGAARRAKLDALSEDVIGPSRDGFVPLRHTLGQGQAGVAKTGGSTPDLLMFQSATEKLRAGNVATAAGNAWPDGSSTIRRKALAGQRGILARQAAALKSDGIAPMYFIGPGTTREQVFLDLYAEGALPVLLAFNDPATHPDLYDLSVRADRNHLNAEGADLLSRQLAQAVAAALPPSSGAAPR